MQSMQSMQSGPGPAVSESAGMGGAGAGGQGAGSAVSGAESWVPIPTDGRDDWEIDSQQLKLHHKIASGSFGDLCVALAWYRGTYCGQDVAIKILKPERLNDSLQQEFAQEVYIMRKVRHKNVVQFIGACTKPPNLSIVTEFMVGGSVYDYIHKQRGSMRLPMVVRVAMDVAKGMDFLHKNNIIHRDLKAANLLMDENEVIEHRAYDHKADVFSFGITLWELLTGKVRCAAHGPGVGWGGVGGGGQAAFEGEVGVFGGQAAFEGEVGVFGGQAAFEGEVGVFGGQAAFEGEVGVFGGQAAFEGEVGVFGGQAAFEGEVGVFGGQAAFEGEVGVFGGQAAFEGEVGVFGGQAAFQPEVVLQAHAHKSPLMPHHSPSSLTLCACACACACCCACVCACACCRACVCMCLLSCVGVHVPVVVRVCACACCRACVCMCLLSCVCVHVPVVVRVCACACCRACVCMCLLSCVCVHVPVVVRVCACACCRACVCMCLLSCVCVHVPAVVRVCACACCRACVCMCLLSCVCVHVCMCSPHMPQLPYADLTPLQAAVSVVQKGCTKPHSLHSLTNSQSALRLVLSSLHPPLPPLPPLPPWQGLRPPIPKGTHPRLAELMVRCWHTNPNERPEFSAVLRLLADMAHEVRGRGGAWHGTRGEGDGA
ncbi:unnamed protein product [Closterium sp. Yama58-4]|nr:unnamed protein product [Closterium sp. Yama58-4]